MLKPIGGLGNRLYAMASGREFAMNQGRNLTIFWPLRWELNARFTDYWETNGFNIVYIDEYNAPWRWLNKPRVVERMLSASAEVISDSAMYRIRDEIGGYDFENYLQKYVNTRKLFIETCFNFYPKRSVGLDKIFFPKPIIVNIVNHWLTINKDDFIGLHIRRTDHANSIASSPNELFSQIIELNPQKKFFLCTDDIETENYFKNKYPNKILTFSKNKARNSNSGMLEAIIDLILLSKSEIIYGSFNSTFSSFAADYGNKKLIVLQK